ncbi:MAG: hypothetical protein ACI9RU_000832 [Litorivivens sp.]|jgi:hypothetical protein
MKKLIGSLLALAFVSGAFAQDFQKIRFGVQVKPNVSWFKPKDANAASDGVRLNWGAGIVADFHFAELYSFSTGISVDNQSGKLTYTEKVFDASDDLWTIVEYKRKYSLRYIEIPLLLKLQTKEIGYMTYFLNVGMGLGANWAASATGDRYLKNVHGLNDAGELDWHVQNEDVAETKINVRDDFKLFRASVIVGGGVEYNINSGTSIVIGVSYNGGFSNIMSKNVEAVELDAEDNNSPIINGKALDAPVLAKLNATNNVIALTVGVMF